jgi:hypothetical protein
MTDTSQYVPSQKIYIDPFNGKLFDFDNVSSRVYLAQTINNLLKAYGDNFVIEGFRVINIEYVYNDLDQSHLIKLNISPGRAVIDSTYIEVTESSYVVYDVTNIDDSGFLILSLDYKYLHTPYQNETSLKLDFFNSAATNNIVEVNGFNNNLKFYTETSRIILNKIHFNKQEKKILKYLKYYNLFTDPIKNKIILLDKEYKLYPKSPLLLDFIRVLEYYL